MRDQTNPPRRLSADTVQALADVLRGLGRKDLTDDRVRELGDGLLGGSIAYPFRTGETPKGGTITRFIAGQLSDAGWLSTEERA